MYKVSLQNPIKLDVTYADDGTCVQYNGVEWLSYDSSEAEEFREKSLKEFKERFKWGT